MAQSFERIHRTNLVGMGVLPLQFPEGVERGDARASTAPRPSTSGASRTASRRARRRPWSIQRADGETERVPVPARIDTPIEVDYFRHGGILPYVLRQLLG